MKIQAVKNRSQEQHTPKSSNTSFKSISGALLNVSGTTMQLIEKTGYMGSFLIQDSLGMTLPRTWTGLKRDKEITGEYNFQEGKEVFGREASTGPYMMAVAPIILLLSGKFCKSTNTNTQLIKRFGAVLKDIVSGSKLEQSVKQNSQEFRKYFYKENIEKIYKNTVTNDRNAQETINYILQELEIATSGKGNKIRNTAYNNIRTKINEKMSATSSNFYKLDSVLVGEGKTQKAFGTIEAMKAMVAYADDAIVRNKQFASIDAEAAENIKNNFAAKRMLVNIANVATVLGGLSILPKLYIRSKISPGAKTLELTKQKQKQQQEAMLNPEQKDNEKPNNPTFKGKGINNKGLFEKFGKLITNNLPDKFHELVEYMGYNFTSTTFACLAIFGLLFPRGLKALERAQVDENGKRDYTEIREILFRDTVSSLSVVFAVPLLTKLFVNSYENRTGYVLSNKASRGKNFFGKMKDILNPYSKLEVLSLSKLDSVYGNVDSKEKLMNFANFIKDNDGDLAKIMSDSKNANLVFNNETSTLESLKKLSREEKNNKIIEIFEKLGSDGAETAKKLMQDLGNKQSSIARKARNFNSFPKFISTWVISPVILGWLIPEFTYHMTRKTHEKQLAQEKQQNKTA